MKRNWICILYLVFHSSVAMSQELNVMTFNIRFNNPNDSLNAWPYRKDKVASQILYHQAHIIGVQEALHGQMTDLQQALPNYKSVGVGRDGGTKGEHSAIFYDTTRLQVLESQTFWLSLTPEVVASKSWDAALTRIVTWIKCRDRNTKKLFFVFNTHFDHVGQEARRQSAELLKQKVNTIAGKTPVIITGDFNAKPQDVPIKVLLRADDPLRFTDAKELSVMPHYGPTGTFNGFRSKEMYDEPIDYIFIKGKWKVLTHATISQTWGGRFASDHFSVLATLKL